MVYSSNLSIGDERGLISSRSSMSVGYSVAKESLLNENSGNWSVDEEPSLKDDNIGEWSTVASFFSVLVGSGDMLTTLYVTVQYLLIAIQVQ